jgi:Leucine-rich repeat (LRR) protein
LQNICSGVANGNISNNPLLATQSWTNFCNNQEGMCQACGTHPDYAPLMALYNSTGGPNWTNNTGWVNGAAGTNCDPCNGWYGVTCSGGRVTSLDLANNNLSGQIPTEIGNLTLVDILSLDNNQLSGSIPPSIGDLSNLKFLVLRYNQLSGSIPSSIGALSNLESLNFSFNQLSGTIPLEIVSLTQLEDLDLSNNLLVGSIPNSIGNLSNLRFLILGVNQLTGSIPTSIGDLSNLLYLYLNNNQLTGSIPSSIGNLSNLFILYLYSNQLSGTIPSSIGSLSNLGYLILYNNNLSDCIPEELQNICTANGDISNNPLLATQSWTNFCSNQEGMCIDCPGFTFEISGPTEVCTGGSLTLDAGGYSEYLWSNGATTQTINPSNITVTTTYTVTVTDANGCTGTDSHTVSVNANPTPTITGPISVCSDGSVTLDAGAGFTTYNWDNNGGISQTATFSNITTTTTFAVTVTDSNGCTGTDDHNIIVNANPLPTITGAISACIGESVTLDAGSGYASYDWSTGESSPSIIVSPSGPTTYTVTVTDVNGCTGTDSHTISTNPLNTYQFLGGPIQTCPGNSISLSWATTGADGVNVIYLPNGLTASFNGNSSSGTITVQGTTLETGPHNITLEPQGGCPNGFIFHPLEVFDLPQVAIDVQEYSGWDFTDASVCTNNDVTLTAYGGISYQWSPSIQNGIPFTPSATDTYSVTVTDINNCTATDEILVTVFDPISYTLDPTNLKICQDTLITLNSPDLDNYSFVNMVPGNGLYATFDQYNTLITSPTQSTCSTCSFDLYITDGNDCSIQNVHTLKLAKSVVQNTTNVSTQGGNEGSAEIQVINGSRPYTVRVNNGNPQLYQTSPFTIPNLAEGSYNLVVTDNDGCTTTASFVINGIDCPMTVSDSIEHIVCYGDSMGRILLTVSGNDGNVTYSWQNNLGTSNILDSLKAGIYSVTVSDDKCKIIKSYTVSQPIQPLGLNASLTHPECDTLNGSITINPVGGWMPYVTIDPDTMLTGLSADTYSFYVTDSLGCTFDTTFTLLVTPGQGDFPVFRYSPQDITVSCANAPLPDYMPTLAYGYPTCGIDSVGFVSASVTKVGDMCSGQTITYVWEYTDAFEHTITHIQRVQILPPPTPTFISRPGDVTINYSNLAQTLQPDTLSYSNTDVGTCMIAGSVMPTIDSSGLMDCSGMVTRTWKAMFCNGMDSIMYVQNITVEKDDIPAPIVSCASSNENSITFGWTSVPEATGYNVEVISPVGLQGMMIGGQNQYQFTGLAIGESVTIQVEAIIPGGCGMFYPYHTPALL